jgi:16S rRNA (uracil1498-N3)-methyltransferase
MNSLIILPGEGWEAGRCVITGDRARSLANGEKWRDGNELRVALLGGERGRARVVHFSRDMIELEVVHTQPSTPLRSIDVIVGLSRPQTVKKVIQAAVMAGVRSLHLVCTENGERSYLDAHLLRPEALEQEVVKALEQIWEGSHPVIKVHKNFKYFTVHHLTGFGGGEHSLNLVASPGGRLLSCTDLSGEVGSMVLAIGPEAGWTQQEISCFVGCGFVAVGLGPRVVRVEVALNYLLGQSLLLYSL